jgi:hypothetical protein
MIILRTIYLDLKEHSFFLTIDTRHLLYRHIYRIIILPFTLYKKQRDRYFVMAILRVYKRNVTFMDLANLVEEISRIGLVDALQKYHNKPLEKEAKNIVAGPSFLQFLNKLFQIQISAGDIIQFESGNNSKYYMLSITGTWDEIIRLE